MSTEPSAAVEVDTEAESGLGLATEPRESESESYKVGNQYDFTLGGEYDPRPQEDTARRTIAYLLIGLLWFVVAATFLLIAFTEMEISDLKDLAVILGPIVTLVSAATGFYYGTKSNS